MRSRPAPARALWQLLPAAALCALFAGVGVVHVTSRVQVVDVGYRLSALEQEQQGLSRTNERLRLELATLKNPARLERLAKNQLGMGPPPAGTVLTLKALAAPSVVKRPLPQGPALARRGKP